MDDPPRPSVNVWMIATEPHVLECGHRVEGGSHVAHMTDDRYVCEGCAR